MPLKIRWYEGIAGLEQLREDWLELAQDAPLFARYEWHLAAARHLLDEDHPISFCRISDTTDRPLSIIPAISDCEYVKPFGNISALKIARDSQLSGLDFPMAQAADPEAIGRAMLTAFKERDGRWKVISWPRVMADSNAARVAAALDHGHTDIIPSSICNTFSTVSSSNPAPGRPVASIIPNRLRKNLASRARRLAAMGQVQMRTARDHGNIDGFFEEFLRVEASGWKGSAGTRTAISLVPSAKAFYRDLLDCSTKDFETDIALLFCGDKAVAGEYLIRTARWLHVYKIGFDEAFIDCSPGQLLLQAVIERAKASDLIDRVSLVTGMGWMHTWHPIPESTMQIGIFRSRWRGTVRRLGRKVLEEAKRVKHHSNAKESSDQSNQGGVKSNSDAG